MSAAKEFWFVVGSQHLYGEEALGEVKANAQKITDALNASGVLPYPLVLQDLAVSADKITSTMKEVNYRDEVAGCDHMDAYILPGENVDSWYKIAAKTFAALGNPIQRKHSLGNHRYGLHELEPSGTR